MFQLDDDVNVNRRAFLVCTVVIIFNFDITACKFSHLLCKTALPVDQRKGSQPILPADPEVVRPEARRDMNNTRSVFRSNKITQNNPERITIIRKCIRKKLLVAQVLKFRTLVFSNNPVWYIFLAFVIVLQFKG